MLHLPKKSLDVVFFRVLKPLPEAHVEQAQATGKAGGKQQESLVGSWKNALLGSAEGRDSLRSMFNALQDAGGTNYMVQNHPNNYIEGSL